MNYEWKRKNYTRKNLKEIKEKRKKKKFKKNNRGKINNSKKKR